MSRKSLCDIIGQSYLVTNTTAWAAHGGDLRAFANVEVRPFHVNKNGLIWVAAVHDPDMQICTPFWTLTPTKSKH